MRSSHTHTHTHLERERERDTHLLTHTSPCTSTLHNHTGTYPTCKSLHIHSYQNKLCVWSSAFLSKTTDCVYVQTCRQITLALGTNLEDHYHVTSNQWTAV